MRAPLLHPPSQKNTNRSFLVRFAAFTLVLVGAIAAFQRQNVALNEKAIAVTQHRLDSGSEESVAGGGENKMDAMNKVFDANNMNPPSDPEKYNVPELASRSKSDLSLRASISEPKDWEDIKDKPTLCNSAFNNKKVPEDICKVEGGVAKVKYPHWGGDLIPVADSKKTAGREFLITTILGKFQEKDPPEGCNTGTVWFLGCDQGAGKKCEGKGGIKRGDVAITTFKGAIAVLDVAQDTYVAMFLANLQRRIRFCTAKEPKLLSMEMTLLFNLVKVNGVKEVLDKDEFQWDLYYKDKVQEAKTAVTKACPTLKKDEKNYFLYAGILLGQRTFWAVYNVPFLFESLHRGDVIRFTNDPKTRRSGTFAKELQLLWSEKEPSFGYEGETSDMGALKACGYKPSFYTKGTDVQPVAKMSTPTEGYTASEFQRETGFDESKCAEIEKKAKDAAEEACREVNALMSTEWEIFHKAKLDTANSRSSTSED